MIRRLWNNRFVYSKASNFYKIGQKMIFFDYLLALSLLSKPIIFELDTSKNNKDIKFLLEAV